MKVALCFFGITRSLKFTIQSIEENIFNEFKNHDIDFDVIMHTYEINSTYRNTRTKEVCENVDNDEYKLLNPKYVKIEDQDIIKEQLNLKQYRTHRDPWNTKYNSVDNYLLGLWSKYQLVQMIQETENEYDYILYIRPDCKYVQPINVDWLKLVQDNVIATPSFHLYGTHSLNDRFAICNSKNYILYGNIFQSALEYSRKMPLHSETILGHHLCVLHKIKIEKVKFIFQRVRINGNINLGDVSLFKKGTNT